MTPERPTGHVGSPLAWLDKAILAATALAACILVIPGIGRLVDDARRTQTVRKLGRIGGTLQEYAASHRQLPSPPDAGPISRAGLYAPTLVSEHRIVADDGTFLSPGSPLAASGSYRVPTVDEVKAAVGTPAFDEMVRTMGGDFGYSLGHRDPMGRLMPIRPLHRRHHPIMADAPDESCERSRNHPSGLAVTGIGAETGEGNLAEPAQLLRSCFDKEPYLPVAGVIAEGHRAAIRGAHAPLRGED